MFIKFGTSVVPFRGRDIPDYHSSKAGVVRLRTEVRFRDLVPTRCYIKRIWHVHTRSYSDLPSSEKSFRRCKMRASMFSRETHVCRTAQRAINWCSSQDVLRYFRYILVPRHPARLSRLTNWPRQLPV